MPILRTHPHECCKWCDSSTDSAPSYSNISRFLSWVFKISHVPKSSHGTTILDRRTGFGESPAALAYARSTFTIAAKATGLPGAIDGPTVGTTGVKLAEATAVTAEFGMTGKLCLTPEQCGAINEGLSPSQDEITWAHEFLDDFEADGGVIRNGSDLPRKARATKILTLAEAFGVRWLHEDDDDHAPAPSDTFHY